MSYIILRNGVIYTPQKFYQKKSVAGKFTFWTLLLMHIQQVFFSVEKAEKLVSVIRVKRCVVQKDTQKMENTY